MDRSDLVSIRMPFVFALLMGLIGSSTAVAQKGSNHEFRPPFQNSPTYQRGSQVVYNPVTKQTERRQEPQASIQHATQQGTQHAMQRQAFASQASDTGASASEVRQATNASEIENGSLLEVSYNQVQCETGFGAGCGDACDVGCGVEPSCGCGGGCADGCCGVVGQSRSGGAGFYAAYEATFLQPYFENNVGFSTTESDGATFNSITDTEFSYDTVHSPRVYFGWKHQDGVGLRVTWWDFDEEAAPISTNPPLNGFGNVTHPAFGAVDISSTIPTDSFSASTSLSAHTIDLEATKETSFGGWEFGVGGGLRYVELDQTYFAQLSAAAVTLLGQIDYRQSLEGFGPTISINASRPLSNRLDLFCKARGSVLYGDSESVLSAGEDLDLVTPFTTNRTTSREDLLSIGEIQLGLKWQGVSRRNQMRKPFFSVAFESQVWNDVGNATSEEGSIGFFGVNTAVGFDW